LYSTAYGYPFISCQKDNPYKIVKKQYPTVKSRQKLKPTCHNDLRESIQSGAVLREIPSKATFIKITKILLKICPLGTMFLKRNHISSIAPNTKVSRG